MKKILIFLSFLLMSVGVQGAAATISAGSNASTATVNGHTAIKVGTSKNSGTMTITVPATSIKLTVYIASWKGENSNTVSITPNTKITPTSVSLISDDGIANNSPFTLSGAESTYKFEFTLSNITTSTTFTLSANKRFVVWGAEYETPSKYTISFVNNLGKSPNSITQETFGSAISLPTTIPICNKCYEENWTFEGWIPSKTNYSTVYKTTFTPTQDTILYALYTRKGIKDTKVVEYKRVTSAQTDWSGDYLIAYSSDIFANGQKGGKTGIGAHASYVTPYSNLIGDSVVLKEWGDLYYVTLEEITEGSNTYVLKTQDTLYNYYTTNSGSNANGLTTNANKETADDYPISVNFISSNDIQLSLGGAAEGSVFRWNDITGVNGKMFRFYHDCSQNPIYLYKKQTSIYPSPIEHTIAPECDSSFITTWDKDKIFIDKGLSYDLTGKTITITDIDDNVVLANNVSATYNSNTDLYQVNTTLTGKECNKINIFISDNTDSTYLIYKVPFMVDADSYTNNMNDENCDVVVLPNTTLTIPSGTKVNRDVKLYSGAHLSVPSGTTYTVNSLSLRKDNLTPSTLGLTGTLTASKLYFDLYIDYTDWYWTCLPAAYNMSNLKYVNGRTQTYESDYWVRWYDGKHRALTQSGSWKGAPIDTTFQQGAGFLFGLSDDLKKKEFRFELPISALTSNGRVDNLHVWGGDTDVRPNHKGWNIIGNPFMNSIMTDLAEPIRAGRLIPSDTHPWDGKWVVDSTETRGMKKLRYAVIPNRNKQFAAAGYYESVVLDDYILQPFTSFFIQMGGTNPEENQYLLFNTDVSYPFSAPRHTPQYDEDEELFLRVKVGDRKTGMFISNKFTDEYEPGDDLESRYPIYQSIGGYKLLYSAINDSIIEHGVQVTSPQGTLYLDPKVDVNKFEYIYANYNNNWYDLKSETVEVNGNFIIQAKRKIKNTPTDIEMLMKINNIEKFIYNNNMYIKKHDHIYNVLGNQVR